MFFSTASQGGGQETTALTGVHYVTSPVQFLSCTTVPPLGMLRKRYCRIHAAEYRSVSQNEAVCTADIDNVLLVLTVLSWWPAAMTQFTHHGMIFVPLGYTAPDGLQFGLEEVTVRCVQTTCLFWSLSCSRRGSPSWQVVPACA